MKKFKKIAAFSLTAVMACAVCSGCDLITTDAQKDMEQVIAEVNISRGEEFQAGGEYAAYADVVTTSEIIKRDMVAMFMSVGYQYVSQGNSYRDTFNLIKESLVNRKMLVQYAMVYFLDTDDDYTLDKFNAYVSSSTRKDVAALEYFLDKEEQDKALYSLRSMINNTIDSQEEDFIKEEEDERTYDTARTTPTGATSTNSDYYDNKYRIYTGKNPNADYGSYEQVEGSTPATRKKAYSSFLNNLLSNNLLRKGENVSDFESLDYFALELKSAYENALINKLTEAFEEEAEAALTEAYVTQKYEETLEGQANGFTDDTFTTKMDEAEDKFVLRAPSAGYGYVINILLPFSNTQTEMLNGFTGSEGAKFEYRAQLLQNLTATDQRGSWFNCADDYSYKLEKDDKAYGVGEYTFFHDTLTAGEDEKYEPLKNYYGQYSYNGTVTKNEEKTGKAYTLKPNKIDIDDFIGIMEGYIDYAGAGVGITASGNVVKDYTALTAEDYMKDGKADYAQFVYYQGKINFPAEYDRNQIFKVGSPENIAFSVVNELSFAYNTDTAGLNTYLGYSVSPYTTNYMKEFEYAAQLAVRGGEGTYVVAPTDYGWHIMYCTFAYNTTDAVYTFKYSDIEEEGTFSNLYYESLKTQAVNNRSKDIQTRIVNTHNAACVTVYEDRYEDLSSLDSANS